MKWKDGAVYKIDKNTYGVIWKEKDTNNYFIDEYQNDNIERNYEYSLHNTYSTAYSCEAYGLHRLKIVGYEDKGFLISGWNGTILTVVSEKIQALKEEINKLQKFL